MNHTLKDSPEQRRHVRRDMLCYLDVTDGETSVLIGHLVDLTLSGMMLSSNHPLPAESAVRTLVIALPEALGGGTVAVRARQVWSRPDVNPRLHAAGFEFVAPGAEPGSEERLDRLIRQWSFGGG